MEKTYSVYLHKNKINNKIYVGQTSQKPQYRWNNGKGYESCPRFYNAIQKYGWDNFEHIILYTNLTLEEANCYQQIIIEKLKTNDPNFGYNILDGGTNYHHTEQQKLKQGQKIKEKWKDQEYRQRVSNGLKEKWKDESYRQKVIEGISGQKSHFYGSNKKGQNNPMFGRHHSEETKKKISQAQKAFNQKNPSARSGKNNSMARAVECIQTGQRFDTCKEAAQWSNISTSSMNRNLKGQQKIAGTHPIYGFKVSFKYIEDKKKGEK